MDLIVINLFLSFFAVYGLASFAGLLSEKSGTVNIGLEGSMIMGGLTFALIMQGSPTLQGVIGGSFLVMLIAGLVGVVYSIIFSIATINFMGDHIIVGTAMNMMAPALAFIFMIGITGKSSVDIIPNSTFVWSNNLNLTALFSLIFTLVVLVSGYYFLKKTSWGLNLRTSGENPYSLETSGISVNKTKWKVNFIVGFFASMAGAMAMQTVSVFQGTVTGMGYIAIAILILGQWKVGGIFIGTTIMAISFSVFSGFIQLSIPKEITQIIPFILPIIFLIFVKLSSEQKFSTRFYHQITDVPHTINNPILRYGYYIFYFWIVWFLFWIVWFIPLLISKKLNLKDEFYYYLLEKESKFSIDSGPAYVGKSFKKDIR